MFRADPVGVFLPDVGAEQLRNGDIERIRQPNNGLETGVSFAALYAADICAIQPNFVRKTLLRKSARFSQGSDIPAKHLNVKPLRHALLGDDR